MRKKIFLCVSVILFSGSLFAQPTPRVTISGHIIDKSNGEPIYGVSVFIANSTLGATTDKEGYYYIKRAPLGKYELVASMMGYERQKRMIQLVAPVDKKFDFKLDIKIFQLPEIKVEAERPRKWRKNLKIFTAQFLGSSENSFQCKILNPEVLDFEYDKFSHLFTAAASQSLVVENQALGYKVIFHMVNFSYYKERFEILTKYLGSTQFEELIPKNEKEKEKWRKNRLKTYLGSFPHFLSSLVSKHIDKDGFKLYYVSNLPSEDQNVRYTRVNVKDLLSQGNLSFERKLHFKGFMEVIYTRSNEDWAYIDFITQGHPEIYEKGDSQTSWIKLKYDSITINTTGNIYEVYPVITYGYWSWKRFADILPIEYKPSVLNK